MERFKTLIGLDVRVYLDSHMVDGVLEHLDEEKIILNDSGTYILIFKKKIQMVVLNPNEDVEAAPDQLKPVEYHKSMEIVKNAVPRQEPVKKEGPEFNQNGVAENNQYGSILPRTLFEQQPADPMDRILNSGLFSDEEDEFSINAGTLMNEEGLLSRSERQKIIEEGKKEIQDGTTE